MCPLSESTKARTTARSARCLMAAVLLAAILAPGCWDHREINSLSIIGVITVDGRPGEVVVHAEIFRPRASSSAGTTDVTKRSVNIAVGTGKSVFEAIRSMNRTLSRQGYLAHVVAIIIGEEYARGDIREILDLWQRTSEYRTTSFILISKGMAADVLTGAGAEVETTIAAQIDGLRRTSRTDGRVTVASVHQVIRELNSDSRAAVTGIVELRPQEQTPVPRSPLPGEEGPLEPAVFDQLTLTGLALIKDAKLVGMVPASDVTKSIVASTDNIQGSTLDVKAFPDRNEVPGADYDTTVEVTGVHAHVWAETENGPKIVVEVKLKVELASELTFQEVNAEYINRVQKAVEEKVVALRTEGIRLLQSVSCDAMGFGEAIHRADPKLWETMKDEWDSLFPTVPFEVRSGVRIHHVGMSRAPAWRSQQSIR